MKRVRFAPSPTGIAAHRQCAERGRKSLARRLDAAADRRHRSRAQRAGRRGGDPARSRMARGRVGRGAGAAERTRGALPRGGAAAAAAFRRRDALRDDGSPTYHLASVVDDGDFGITHVVRGNDHRPNEALHRRLHAALGTQAPEYVHHGLILGADGKKMSKRAEGATIASLRESAFRPRRCGAISISSGCRSTTCATTCRASAGTRSRRSRRCRTRSWPSAQASRSRVPVFRGARDLVEARAHARRDPERRPAKCRWREGGRRSAVPRAARARERRRRPASGEVARARAEGGRRRPARAAARAHGSRPRPRACGGRRGARPRETLRRLDAAV